MGDGRFWGFVLLAACAVAIVASGVWYVGAARDCRAKGGALVEDAFGWGYVCVEKKR